MASKQQIANLQAQLTLDIKQYVNELMRAGASTKSTTDAIGKNMVRAASHTNSLNMAQQRGSKSASRFGVVMQQSGYQVQDFAVQVMGGQSAMVAFAQQGSQMLGVFGAGGAIAGAVLAVGSIAFQLYSAKQRAGEMTEEVVALDDALKSLAATAERVHFEGLTNVGKESAIKAQIDAKLDEIGSLSQELTKLDNRTGKLQKGAASAIMAGADPGALSAMSATAAASEAKERERITSRIIVLQNQIIEAGEKLSEIQTGITSEMEKQEAVQIRMNQSFKRHQQEFNIRFNEDMAKLSASIDAEDAALLARAEAIKQGLDPLKRELALRKELEPLIRRGLITQQEADAHVTESMTKGKEKLTDYQKEMAQMWNSVSDRAGQAATEMLMTWEGKLGDLVSIVGKAMAEILVRMAVINPILNTIFGGTEGFSLLPTLFGGTGATPTGKAGGGTMEAGAVHLVGEGGPELVRAGRTSTVIPAGRTAELLGTGNGGDVYNLSYNFESGVTRQEVEGLLPRLVAATKGAIADAQMRRGAYAGAGA